MRAELALLSGNCRDGPRGNIFLEFPNLLILTLPELAEFCRLGPRTAPAALPGPMGGVPQSRGGAGSELVLGKRDPAFVPAPQRPARRAKPDPSTAAPEPKTAAAVKDLMDVGPPATGAEFAASGAVRIVRECLA